MSDTAVNQAELVVRVIAQTAVDNEKYFCELDAVVGDGDFGYSLARGFEIVLSDWDSLGYTDVASLLKKTAIVLTKRIGGTSGPIWGTAFLRAGGALTDKPDPSGADVIAAMRASIEGIKQRGRHRSRPQDAARRAGPGGGRARKRPRRRHGSGTRARSVRRSQQRGGHQGNDCDAGRASYTGERSRDSVDAGAVGVAVMFEEVSKAWQTAGLEPA